MFGLGKKDETNGSEESEVEQIPVEEERIGACKQIFQGRCQIHQIAADEKCRCSQWE